MSEDYSSDTNNTIQTQRKRGKYPHLENLDRKYLVVEPYTYKIDGTLPP
jgi:hypothetical protein